MNRRRNRWDRDPWDSASPGLVLVVMLFLWSTVALVVYLTQF